PPTAISPAAPRHGAFVRNKVGLCGLCFSASILLLTRLHVLRQRPNETIARHYVSSHPLCRKARRLRELATMARAAADRRRTGCHSAHALERDPKCEMENQN